MKRPAVFFDRDNTLIVGDEYLGDPAKVQLVPGAAVAVARARRLGYATVVISNQSGVARGLFDEAAVHAVNQRLDQLLLADDPAAVIDRHEFCPFHPDAKIEQYKKESNLRKPKPGMILQAAEKLALDLQRSWMIGDAPRDIDAGISAGCRAVLFSDPKLPPSPAAKEPGIATADFTAASLKEALDFVESNPEPSMRIAVTESSAPAATTSSPKPAPGPGPTAGRPAANPTPTRATPVGPASIHNAPIIGRPIQAHTLSTARIESQLEQILTELRRRDIDEEEFSVSKLLAGIVQVLALAVVFLAYLYREETNGPTILLLATFLQTLTIALLIMGRQR